MIGSRGPWYRGGAQRVICRCRTHRAGCARTVHPGRRRSTLPLRASRVRVSGPLTLYAAAPAACPGALSSRTPRVAHPARAVARGCASIAGIRKMDGDGTGWSVREATPDTPGAPAMSPVPATPPAPVPSPASTPSPALVLPSAFVPSPPPAPARPRRLRHPHHPRSRTPAVPASRRRAAVRPLPPGCGRSAGAAPRTLPRLSPPAAARRPLRRPRCSGASGCRR